MATEKVYTDTEICLKAVDEYEVLYDAREEHLVRKSSTGVTFTKNPEAFQRLNQCQSVLLMCLKQRIILNEPVVRFHHKNDISDLQAKIVETGLPNDVYEAVRDISKEGYKTLKDAGLLDALVEFDAERLANVVAFDKTLKMAGYFDMLAMVEEDDPGVKSRKGTNGKERQKKMKTSKPSKSSKKSSNSVQKQSTNSDSNFDDLDSDELDEVKTNSDDTISARNLGRAVVTVAMTARNQVPALDIFRQLLFSHIHTLSKFYILVFHVGPLVEKQEVVLYEYKVPKTLHRWLKNIKSGEHEKAEKGENTNKTNENENNDNGEKVTKPSSNFYVSLTVQKTNHLGPLDSITIPETRYLNINHLEREFRFLYGKQLQQLSPFKDYFRYVVYDVPGIKDHRKDNKARYEHYMAKQEQKKERLRATKEAQKTEEEKIEEALETSRTMVSSKLGEVGSVMGVLDRLDETNNVSFLEKLEERLEELNSDTDIENSNQDNNNDDTDNDADDDITEVSNIDGRSVIDMLRDREDFEDYEPESSIVCLPSSASEDGSCSAWILNN